MSHPHFQVYLYEPCIPQNTGNIGRLCVGMSAKLIILGQPAFSLEDRERRRAGLDYWDHLLWEHVENKESWQAPQRCFSISKFASKNCYDETFQLGDSFIFGNEIAGLPEHYKQEIPCLRLPMNDRIRSYNLANSVAMVLAEATRQVFH